MGDAYATMLQEQLLRENKDDASMCLESLGVPGNEIPAMALETQPGDLIMFNLQLKHASFGGNSRRRMFTFLFTKIFPEDRKNEVLRILNRVVRNESEQFYGEAVVRTAGSERMKHLKQFLDHEHLLPELIKEAQEKKRIREVNPSK